MQSHVLWEGTPNAYLELVSLGEVGAVRMAYIEALREADLDNYDQLLELARASSWP